MKYFRTNPRRRKRKYVWASSKEKQSVGRWNWVPESDTFTYLTKKEK